MGKNILITVVATLGVFLSVLNTSCSKDECESVTCFNNGTCVDGKCVCPTGYTGTYCEKKLCEANNTAKVRFQNKTGTSLTYEVVWDGSTITTVGPGSTSDYYTVAAGHHTLHFKIANSGGQEACTQSTPNLAVCSSMEYWCTK
ncbi:MAG: Tenascin domain [Flavipsychrobacter sp.]|jgi:hypothetical protein|nr:Tenascin domain [Flavipsychrobacter sp.]